MLCRVGGLFVLAPVFSAAMIPMRAKLMLAVAISFALTPIAVHGQTVPPTRVAFVLLMREGDRSSGSLRASRSALVGAAVQARRELLDTMIGFSFASLIDPINKHADRDPRPALHASSP